LKPTPPSSSDAPLIRPYMPELDAVRGIAILLVLLFHGMARPLHAELSVVGRSLFAVSQYGWTGVNLFFVLSGFLITGILLDAKHGPDYFRRFYFRRALRILPALYGTLLILLIGGWISFRFAAISILFLANFAAVLGLAHWYGPLWSLAVEEHFYMLWPFVVHRCSARKLTIVASVVCIASPLLRILNLVGSPVPQHFASLYTWFNLDGLSLGALLAIWLRAPSFRRERLASIALPITIASGVAFFLLVGRQWADATVVTSACNLASAGFLSWVLLVGTSHWKFLVDRPILKFYGFISYGLYLIHILAFHLSDVLLSHPLAALVANQKPLLAMLLRFGGGLVLGTGLAFLSRRSLEERFLRINHSSRGKVGSSSCERDSVEATVPINS
jgi:peptidoglycan/LPS O-acetylase OafA/YrhL